MILFDVIADQLQNALVAIEKQLKMLEGDGLLREGQTTSELMRFVSVSNDLKEAMEGTDYVQVPSYSQDWAKFILRTIMLLIKLLDQATLESRSYM